MQLEALRSRMIRQVNQSHQWLEETGSKSIFLIAIIYFLLTFILALHRYESYYANTDHGIFNHVFWNGVHGHFFQSSLSSSLSTNVIHAGEVPDVRYQRLGQHFTPALLLWHPLYALFPSPGTLIFIQVSLLTLGGGMLFFLARCYLPIGLSTLITASYYASSSVIGPALGNFFDYCQIPLYLFLWLWAREKQRWILFSLMTLCILAVREDTAIVLLSFSVFFIISGRSPRLGWVISAISVLYLLGVTNVIMPLFSDDITKRFMIEKFSHFAQGQEASTIDIILGIISNPLRLITELFTPFDRKLNYLINHWIPLAFLPLISVPAWICTAFPLLQLFLQSGQERFAISVRYAVAVVPGLFFGMILWWSFNQDFFQRRVKRFWQGCLVLSLILVILINPHQSLFFLIPDSIHPWVYQSLPQQWHHVREINGLIAQISASESVSATRFLIPRLSSRRTILIFPHLQYRNDQGQETLVDRVFADLWQLERRSSLKKERLRLEETVLEVEKLLSHPEYGLVGFREGIVLFQKGVETDENTLQAWLIYRRQLDSIFQNS